MLSCLLQEFPKEEQKRPMRVSLSRSASIQCLFFWDGVIYDGLKLFIGITNQWNSTTYTVGVSNIRINGFIGTNVCVCEEEVPAQKPLQQCHMLFSFFLLTTAHMKWWEVWASACVWRPVVSFPKGNWSNLGKVLPLVHNKHKNTNLTDILKVILKFCNQELQTGRSHCCPDPCDGSADVLMCGLPSLRPARMNEASVP